jgi:VIT1/CCC1 family predicted Fe2+/Mn2+ transporter
MRLALFVGKKHRRSRSFGDWRKNGLKMVAIGLGAAAVGFLIGRLFHTT